jgi:hypothetical protein
MAVTSPHAHAAPAFAISASPASVHLAAGQATSVRVTDEGTAAMRVGVGLTGVAKSGANGKCGIKPAPGTGVTVAGPASFVLGPGQSRSVAVTVAPGAPSQDDALVFASSPGQGGNAQVSGAVGTQVVIGGASECVSALPPVSHGVPAAAAGGLAAGLTAALAGGWAWLSRRRRRQPAAS